MPRCQSVLHHGWHTGAIRRTGSHSGIQGVNGVHSNYSKAADRILGRYAARLRYGVWTFVVCSTEKLTGKKRKLNTQPLHGVLQRLRPGPNAQGCKRQGRRFCLFSANK